MSNRRPTKKTVEIIQREVCDEATFLLNGPRKDDYGKLEDNMRRWRDGVRVLVPGMENVTCEQLAKIMTVLKMSRDAHSPKRDNMVDGAAYMEITERSRIIDQEDEGE